MWKLASESRVQDKCLAVAENAHMYLGTSMKSQSLGLAILLASCGVSIAQESSMLNYNDEQITFVTSHANVQSIIEERQAFPSIDEAVSKVIPNHLIFYRSKNGNHKIHKVIEVSQETQWTDISRKQPANESMLVNLATPEPPKISSPVIDSAVDGGKVKISWKPGSKSIKDWYLHVSTFDDGKNLLDSGDLSSETTSYTVDNLPADNSTIHVKLWYREHGKSAWQNIKSQFLSSLVKPELAQIIKPLTGPSLVGSQPQTVPFGDGLVALYNFDGDLTDASGNGLHGTSPASLKFQSTADGRSTVHFDGVNDHIVLGRSDKFDFSDSKKFTFAAWVRLPDTSPLFKRDDVSMNLISKYDKGIAGEYYLDLKKSGNVGLLRETSPFEKSSANRITPNQFSLVAGTYDGSVARVYVNGSLSGATTMGPSGRASNTDVVLGARHRNGVLENYFQGQIDQLMIYDRALTDTEILSMYKAN